MSVLSLFLDFSGLFICSFQGGIGLICTVMRMMGKYKFFLAEKLSWKVIAFLLGASDK
jgi:hypothetical protein